MARLLARAAWLVVALFGASCARAVTPLHAPDVTVDATTHDVFDAARPDVFDAASPMEDVLPTFEVATPDIVAPADVPVPVGCVPTVDGDALAPPRPLWPMSTSHATSLRPTVRWALPAGVDSACAEFCADRACAHVLSIADGASSARPSADLPHGAIFWRLRSRSGARVSPATSATWELFLPWRSATNDTAWGSVLDLDGDGVAEIVIGAPKVDHDSGRGYVFERAGGSTPAMTLRAPRADTGWFGDYVTTLGDVNGDGYGDLAIGAPGAPAHTAGLFVYLGGPHGVAASPSLAIDGMAAQDGLRPVLGGDLDGDGYGDMIVAADESREVAIYRGGPAGLAAVASLTLTNPGPPGEIFGYTVQGALDLDADGRTDLVVAGQGSTTFLGATTEARLHVYLGQAGGPVQAPSQTITAENHSTTQAVVADVGDVNGDGRSDITLADLDASGTSLFEGGSGGVAATPTVVFAASAAHDAGLFGNGFGDRSTAAGDVDADGYDDLALAVVGSYAAIFRGGPSGPATTPSVVLSAPSSAVAWFGEAMSGARDFDGDGLDDVLVGAYAGNAGDPGHAYLYGARSNVFSGTAPLITFTGPGSDPGAAGDYFGDGLQ